MASYLWNVLSDWGIVEDVPVVAEDDSVLSFEVRGPASSYGSTATAVSDRRRPGGDERSKRRATIPPKPDASVSLWSIMKNCIGKELSKIPMPVNFNEPLSMLQRLTEDLEYSGILDSALTDCEDSCEELCYVAAFTISSYSTTTARTGKPFNPLLGETYECDRSNDLGWKSLAEQVSHHPPAAALHAEGGKGWRLWQEFTMSSKFRGKYLQIIPLGISHLEFPNGNHYTWRKVTTTVHNIIVGRLWIDNHGEMSIENHKTGDKCHLKYLPYSYFSRETPRKVTGIVTNRAGDVKWVIQGTWDEYVECARVVSTSGEATKPVFETAAPRVLWKCNSPLPGCERFYNFTKLAVELNEPEVGPAPTDSRFRPDQRAMENGDFETANSEKLRLEEKQRQVRRQTEAEAELALAEGVKSPESKGASSTSSPKTTGSSRKSAKDPSKGSKKVSGRPYKNYEPKWFRKGKDPLTTNLIHSFTGEYWSRKISGNWDGCPDIY